MKVKPEDCPKLDECYKVKMILDKELLDFQYVEVIRTVCAKCSEGKVSSRQPSIPEFPQLREYLCKKYPELCKDQITKIEDLFEDRDGAAGNIYVIGEEIRTPEPA